MRTDQMMMKKTKRPSHTMTTTMTTTVAATRMVISMETHPASPGRGPQMAILALAPYIRDDESTNEASEVPRSMKSQVQNSLLCKPKR
jgi:hypothetical protein